MLKLRVNKEMLVNILNQSNIEEYIPVDEILNAVDKKIELLLRDKITTVNSIHMSVDSHYKMHINIYGDLVHHMSKKTGKVKYNELLPHAIELTVYSKYTDKELMRYINVDKVRISKITEVME